MGSLMGGWDAPVHDPKLVRCRRNKSLTKEEIENFWKSKKPSEVEHHLKSISPSMSECLEEKMGAGRKYQRSTTFPPAKTDKDSMHFDQTESNLEKFNKNCWWTRSSSAFLNEPPVLSEGATKTYISQFHVGNLTSSKQDNEEG